jgi:hypothetical protein
MARRPTGRRPGAPDGNANALKHGAHSMREKAERLRAESALRSVRALRAADELEERSAEIEAAGEGERLDASPFTPEDIRRLMSVRDQPNLRGFLIDKIRHKVGILWMAMFWHSKGDIPEWVIDWVNIQPNIHASPEYNEGDDLAPGVPGEGYTPGKIPRSTRTGWTRIDLLARFDLELWQTLDNLRTLIDACDCLRPRRPAGDTGP